MEENLFSMSFLININPHYTTCVFVTRNIRQTQNRHVEAIKQETPRPLAPPLAFRLHLPHPVKSEWNNKLLTGDLHPNRQLKQQLILMQNIQNPRALRRALIRGDGAGVRGTRPTAWLIPGYWANRRQWGNSKPRLKEPLRSLFCNFASNASRWTVKRLPSARWTLIDAIARSRKHFWHSRDLLWVSVRCL